MAQTSVSQYQAAAFAGMTDGVGTRNVRTLAAEEAIPFAYPVKLGTDAATQALKATTGASTIGFALATAAVEQTSAGVAQYATKEPVSILTQGRFWIMTDDAVVAGTAANLKTASGTLTDASVTSGIEAFTKVTVTFITATTAAGLVLVEVK